MVFHHLSVADLVLKGDDLAGHNAQDQCDGDEHDRRHQNRLRPTL